jgi:hypothetical protein
MKIRTRHKHFRDLTSTKPDLVDTSVSSNNIDCERCTNPGCKGKYITASA